MVVGRKFSTVEEAILELQNGGFIILSDNEDRENEGDLVSLAQKATPKVIHEMLQQANGLMCVPVNNEIAKRLELTDMVEKSTDPHQTPFTITIDGNFEATGVTTGVSAFDRAASISHIADENAKASDFNRPGHIQPLIAKPNGLRERIGHTEAGVDLALLAGSKPAAIIIEVLGESGEMAKRDELFDLSKKLNVPYITIEQILEYMDANNIEFATDVLAVK